MEWAPDVLKKTELSMCGSTGRPDTPGVMRRVERETGAEPWFKTLLVSMKWKLRKAYKLELNDEEKTALEINSVRKESKDML